MTSNRGNQGNAQIERDDEPLDPDILLITNYLGHELSTEEEAQVEERLVSDEAFYEKVIPYMKIWTAPIDYRKELAVYEAEQRAQAAPAPAPVAAPAPARVKDPGSAYVFSRASRVFSRPRVSWLVAAASLVIWVGAPTVAYQIGVADGREQQLVQTSPAPDQMPVPAGSKAPVEQVARTVRVGRSSFVHLEPGSRFAYTSRFLGAIEVVGLNGEASIEVGWLDPQLEVSTPAGMVELSHGTYAFRCTSDPDPETLVTVGHGKAILKGSTPLKMPDVSLTSGEHGRVAYPAPPRRTSGGDGYPALDRTGRTRP